MHKTLTFLTAAWLAWVGTASAQQTGTVAFSSVVYLSYYNQSSANVDVIYSGILVGAATVNFSTSDGTAVAGIDYSSTSQILTFSLFNRTNTVSIPLLTSGGIASDRTVNLNLTNPNGYATLGSPSNAVLTILSKLPPSASFDSSTYSAQDTDTEAIVTVIFTGNSNGTATVTFSTRDGTASNGVDYTAVTTNLSFDVGVLTNTVSIPLLSQAGLAFNKTVNLVLSNPNTYATLGSPSNAVLTIFSSLPPEFDFSAPQFSALNKSGSATVMVTRFGDTSGDGHVDYATSDDTAVNGVDYVGTSGTLVFAPGDLDKSFSFQVIEHATFQSNKLVDVALSNPSGADLGAQDTAVVKLVNDRTQTITFTNSETADIVTITLQYAGTMELDQFDSPFAVLLDGTDQTSVMTVKVKPSATGTTPTEISGITGDGGCRYINAAGLDLIGDLQLGDYLGKLRVHDIADGVSLIAGGLETQRTTIVAHDIGDGVSLDIGSRIDGLDAARWIGGSITAPSIRRLSIHGDQKLVIPGDMGAQITLSGAGVETNMYTLGTLAVARNLTNVTVEVDDGSVGTVKVQSMIDSYLYVGYQPTDPDAPLAGGDFVSLDLNLKNFGIRSPFIGFVNSFVVAPNIGKVRIGAVQTDNLSRGPFGFLAGQSITSLTVRIPAFKWKRTGANDQSVGDFHVIY